MTGLALSALLFTWLVGSLVNMEKRARRGHTDD